MSRHELTIRAHANGFSLVADIGKPSEHIVASRIHDEPTAKMLGATPALASAAIFAVQMLNAQGTDSLLRIACVKLINALGQAGIDMNAASSVTSTSPDGNDKAALTERGITDSVAPHPDTTRLDHLIAWDRCQIGPVDADGLKRLEKIEFVFENLSNCNTRDVVRTAIDQSIKALS